MKVAAEIGIDHRKLWKRVNDAKLKAIDPAGEMTREARKRIRDLEKEDARLRRDLDFEKNPRPSSGNSIKATVLRIDRSVEGVVPHRLSLQET